MIIRSVNLEAVCGITSTLPITNKPEFAFAGKSNVGKSSLINSVMNRKAYAKTSSQPGKTQTINYYNINDNLYLVDLPGYGFASVSEETKMKWGDMIENYLHTSRSLKLVFLLIDIRHNPGENDRNMFEWIIYQGFTPVIIATKSDKLKPSQIESHVQMLRDELHMDDAIKVIPFSSVSKDGLQEIYDIMDALVDEYYEDNDFDDESTPKLKDGKVAKGPRKKGKKKWENPDGTSNDKRLLPPKEDKKGSEKSARSSSRKTSSNAKTNADKKSQQNAQGSNHASTRTSAKSNTSYKKTSSKAADKAPQKKKKRTIRNVHSKKN